MKQCLMEVFSKECHLFTGDDVVNFIKKVNILLTDSYYKNIHLIGPISIVPNGNVTMITATMEHDI